MIGLFILAILLTSGHASVWNASVWNLSIVDHGKLLVIDFLLTVSLSLSSGPLLRSTGGTMSR